MLRFCFKLAAAVSITLALLSTGAFAKTYQHPLGEVEISKTPKRVVVLGYASLDFIDSLNIEPVGMPKSMLPGYLAKFKSDEYGNTGTSKEVNFEKLFTLKPDLIIAEARMAEIYDDLKAIAPTYMYDVDTEDYWNSARSHWLTLGEIFDKQAQVESMIAEIQTKIDYLSNKVSKNPPKALTVSNSGNNLALFGPQSRFAFVYNEAGFIPSTSENIATKASLHGNLISFEYIADAQPDLMLVLDREQAVGKSVGKAKALFDNDLVKSTPAAKNQKILFMDPIAWYLTAGGYQSTQIMVDELISLLN